VFAATLPDGDNPNVQLVPGGGTYRFRLYRASGSETSFDVRVIVENRDGIPSNEGRVDLNVFLAPALGITAPGTDAKLQAVLSRVDDILGQVALQVGDVDYYQLADAAYDVVSAVQLPALLAESVVATETRMNVFFVQGVQGPGGFITLGISSALPGPKRNGTRVSGVAVDFVIADAATVGQVAAHEMCHYLGLFHTTEADGSNDAIADTLPCPATGTNAVCTTEGGGYLMHWKSLASALPVISAGQAHVILAHPLVDPVSPLAGLSALAQKATPAPAYVELPPGFCGTCARRR
jgi:hypothetical protein